ncbi:cytoplasmic protein [Enterococcus quebecensis]|uniref:Cytoplasmic protein n=1 Tax=Enterococcus quebecensis TaxID=903983 RepID=A0A1E5GQA0_9ENTE|nr:cytoplasmic protein [Enterococcus quebecensis]
MFQYLKQVHADKIKYNEEMARLKKLPADYQMVYKEVQKFLWEFTAGDGMEMLPVMLDLLDFFEEGAANNIPILDLVGEDVGSFAENTLSEMQGRTRINELKRKMNERIAKKLRNE